MNTSFKKAVRAIREAKSVLISGHANPDGDSIGSLLSLGLGLAEDSDAIADEMRSIRGIKIVALFREKSKKFLRVSLRSKDKINIAAFAELYGGGGHFDVAGCSLPNNRVVMANFLNKLSKIAK